MLPVPSLDDQTYEELLSEARNVISSTYPDWTNFNEHDPGVTLLELFAMLVESQQFYMDQIGRENRIKYLKLLGLKRRPKLPAQTRVHVDSEYNLRLIKGSSLLAGDLRFEMLNNRCILAKDLKGAMAVCDEEKLDAVWLSGRRRERIGFLPFGPEPKEGNACVIVFNEAPPENDHLALYVSIRQGEACRNPLSDTPFVPLCSLAYEYYSNEGWKPLHQVTDETKGFLYDGFFRFSVGQKIPAAQLYGEEGYFIRVRITEGEYDIPPQITYMSMNIVAAVQRETVCEHVVFEPKDGDRKDGRVICPLSTELALLGETEVYELRHKAWFRLTDFEKDYDPKTKKAFIAVSEPKDRKIHKLLLIHRRISMWDESVVGEGTGFPEQEFSLEDTGICEDPITLLIEDEQQKNGYRLWERVDDFASSDPEDRHFVFDSESGIIRFGDGRRGRVPEGEIRLASCTRTEGRGGNIRKQRIERFMAPELLDIGVTNITEGWGGMDEESVDDAFLRARECLNHPITAVSSDDYERLAKNTPGLVIMDAKVISAADVKRFRKNAEADAVHIVVEPYGYETNRYLEKIYEKNILNHIEPYRMLGTDVRIYFPAYVDVEVYAELSCTSVFLDMEERVRQVIEAYFDERQKRFGESIIYSNFYGYLLSQDFITQVRSLSISSKGLSAFYNRLGDLLIPPHAKVRFAGVKVSLSVG